MGDGAQSKYEAMKKVIGLQSKKRDTSIIVSVR